MFMIITEVATVECDASVDLGLALESKPPVDTEELDSVDKAEEEDPDHPRAGGRKPSRNRG